MSLESTDRIYRHFLAGFKGAAQPRARRRIGAELKFPFVNFAGEAVSSETVDALWGYLVERGWRADKDPASGRATGARKAGESNDTVASCETGYCKAEFSLAHAAGLFELRETFESVLNDIRPFLEQNGVRLLCYGIQPVTPPSAKLLMKKMRAGFWDKALPSNNVISREDGDDVHLFTVNACSHVHVGVMPEEAVRIVNTLNGLAGAQISLTAHSPVLNGWIKTDHKCVNEKLWDWWQPAKGRVGVPSRPFADLADYVRRIADLRPVYVKREAQPILLCRHYESFSDYFAEDTATGLTVDGREIKVVPEMADIAVHNSCYWYTARISRYFTVENRVFDQQPGDALLAPAALTLGLVCAAEEAWEEVSGYSWDTLREAREQACLHGMDWSLDGMSAVSLTERMLELAELGLRRRARGEEAFLVPLKERLAGRACPSDEVMSLPRSDWPAALLKERAI